jgi:hypothetical protein
MLKIHDFDEYLSTPIKEYCTLREILNFFGEFISLMMA